MKFVEKTHHLKRGGKLRGLQLRGLQLKLRKSLGACSEIE